MWPTLDTLNLDIYSAARPETGDLLVQSAPKTPVDCVEFSPTLDFVHFCPGSRKLSTRKTLRNSWFITIQVLRLRSSSSSSRTLRLQRIWWIHRLWFSNLKRSRYLQRVNSCCLAIGLLSIGTFQQCGLLPGGDCVGLPHQSRLDERQPPLLNQGQSRDHYHWLFLLGRSARVKDGHQTLSFWKDLTAQVTAPTLYFNNVSSYWSVYRKVLYREARIWDIFLE